MSECGAMREVWAAEAEQGALGILALPTAPGLGGMVRTRTAWILLMFQGPGVDKMATVSGSSGGKPSSRKPRAESGLKKD
jgi:hypothetical protein